MNGGRLCNADRIPPRVKPLCGRYCRTRVATIVVPKPKQAGNCTNPIGDFACRVSKVPEAVRLKIPWRPHQRHWRGCSACNASSCYKFSIVIIVVFILDGSFVPAGGESKT